jgi:hypothetical protein
MGFEIDLFGSSKIADLPWLRSREPGTVAEIQLSELWHRAAERAHAGFRERSEP